MLLLRRRLTNGHLLPPPPPLLHESPLVQPHINMERRVNFLCDTFCNISPMQLNTLLFGVRVRTRQLRLQEGDTFPHYPRPLNQQSDLGLKLAFVTLMLVP
jgi:hypothetical protein